MKKLVVGLLAVALLTGCNAPTPEATATASPSLVAPTGPSDIEREEQREIDEALAAREAEALRLAEEKRVAEAEAKRLADEEAARIKEIERQQAEANRQLEERLKREYPVAPPVQPVPVPKAVPAPAPATDPGMAWINQMQAQYNTYAAAGTVFHITHAFPASCRPDAVGCVTLTKWSNGDVTNINLYLKPYEVGSDPFILFHEIAHTLGVYDECAADNFARARVGSHPGAYC